MKKTFWNKLTARGTRGKTRCAAAVLALAMTFSMGAPLALAAQPEESIAAVTETVSAQQETAMPTLQTETPELAAQDPEAPPVQATEAEENSTNQHTPENSVVLTPEEIRAALDASLKRLQTDYLDLYQVHWPQRSTNCFGKLGYSWNESAPTVTLLETLEALTECQRAGKIRYIGVSNETAFGVMRYLHLADKHDLPRIVTIQNPYSLLNRSYEVGLAEVTQYEEVELLAYSCLGFGTLTGKYLNGAKPAGARNTLFSRFTRYSGEQTQKAVAAYVDIAKRHGLDPAQMALAFVRRQPFVASTLLGATTMEQLKTNIESFHLNLSEEVLAEIEAVHQVYTYPAP